MENDDYIKKKKEELNNNIKNSKKELKMLRMICNHPEIKVKNINIENSSLELRRVCKICEEILGFPTNKELSDNGYK